jgi:mono/diheme cytochrome c family protein
MILRRCATLLFAGALGATTGLGQGAATVWDGVYTDAQAERGAKRYADTCAMCHGVEMSGGGGVPGLVGAEFLFGYNDATVAALVDYIKANMPPGQPGALSDAQYVDVVAAILKGNGFPASPTLELPSDPKALAQVRILRAKP